MTSTPNLPEIPRMSAAQAVGDAIRGLIESGELPVGAKLPSENELARSFRVSRPVIREGLGGLRAAGILESRGGAGTFVRSSRAEGGLMLQGRFSSAHLHEVRCHLEIPGVALAALRRTDEQLAQLEEVERALERATDVAAWVREDVQFHVILAEATGNPVHARMISELRELQFEQSVAVSGRTGGLAAPTDEHRAIVKAVRERDSEAASEAMRAHLLAIQQRTRDV